VASETAEKHAVRSFWEHHPCGAKTTEAPEGTRQYFADVERRRQELEPFIERYADFRSTTGQDVLEIGVGLGTDFVRFARAGARIQGVDLTTTAVRLVTHRLALEDLEGEVEVADAEQLTFPDGSFDVVYSWGVLHHTPDTATAISEAIRVLRPGGRLCVMLYGRRSWVTLALWVRYALLRGQPARTLSSVVANHMESQGTKAFTAAEVRALLQPLHDVKLDRPATAVDRRVAGPVANLTHRWLGWYIVARGVKPAGSPGSFMSA
jgi:ubiquinone/menaquinone biosynthesis C-methylase UbiE